MFNRIDENLLLFSSKFAKQKEYWENKLSGDLTKTQLLLKDRQCDDIPGKEKEKIEIHILQPLIRQVEHLSKNSMLSIYLVLLTTLKVLIDKYIHNRESIVISPVYIQNVSNHTLNKCVFIRDAINENMTFKELLLKVRQSTLEAYENQDYPFNKLIEHLVHWERKPDHRMISNIGCLLENIHDKTVCEDLKDILVFSFGKKGPKLYGNILYDPALYETVYLEQMGRHFVKILGNAIENIDRGLNSISLLSVDENRQLLFEFNSSISQSESSSPIHLLFEEQVTRTPDHIAVISMAPEGGDAVLDEGQEFTIYITYRELYKRAHQLAQQLREKGVGPDTIIALSVGRSVEMIILIMGILKAGGAFMPLDPEYPEERKQYMLKDSGTKILLTRQEIAAISSPKESNVDPTGTSSYPRLSPAPAISLAYVIYTSGTTGKPKGVMLEHHSVVNLVSGLDERIYSQYKKGLAIAMLSPYVFDASIKQVFAALLLGHRLNIASTAVRTDAFALLRFFQKHQIEVSDGTPTHIRLINEVIKENWENLKLAVKHFIIGGEELSRQVMEDFFKGLRTRPHYPGKPGVPTIINVYGPTECCVDTTSYEVSEKTIRVFNHIPLGRPMPNYRVYILGREKELLPISVAGELCISGTGTARGYLNNPMLTHDKFIDNPFVGGEKFYCSGDIARWMPDGNIAFLGRFDQQVKIRGFRIELEEIESLLLNHEMVKEALVVAREEVEGDKYLCAYIVPYSHRNGSLDQHELREYLAGVIPDYIIPSYFMEIKSVPLTPNGKIDRKALPRPEIKSSQGDVAPRDEIEKKLLEIWIEVLDGNTPGSIGIDANFFHLGGHSLNATKLAAKIHKAFDVKLKLAQIFKTPTIRELSGYIRVEPVENKFASLEPGEKKEYYILSSAQKRLYILHQMGMERSVYNIPGVVTLKGTLNRRKFEEIFRELIERHESLRTSFGLIDKEPVQKIHHKVEFEIEYYDLIEENHLSSRTIKNFIRPFDLSHAPLLRVGLVELEKKVHLLIVDMHHIISDGISMKIFVQNFMELHQDKELALLKFQYKDYSQWQKREKETQSMHKQAAYWLEQFQAEIPVLELPTDFARTGVQGFAGSRLSFQISHEETKRLKELALEKGTTLYVILLSAFNVFLSKITNQETIVVGTVVAGRRHWDLEQIIGMFVNTLGLINYPEGQKHLDQFIEEIKKSTLEAFENQDYPFEELVEQVALNRDFSRNPLFDVLFLLQDSIVEKIDIPDLKLEPHNGENDTSKFDLTLLALEEKETLKFIFEYRTELFKPATIQRFINYFRSIMQVVVNQDTIKLSGIEIISRAEKNRLLFEFNATGVEYPKDKTIHDLFEKQVERTPDRIALIGLNAESRTQPGKVDAGGRIILEEENSSNDSISITYKELNQKSNQLAYWWREKGIQPDTTVGILVERSLHMVIGILGTLKSGSAYLPIAPDYPVERILYVLGESDTRILLTTRNLCEKIENNENVKKWGGEVVSWGELPMSDNRQPGGPDRVCLPPVPATSLAYVIYTSGSTGKPKGVMVEHASVVNILSALNNRYPFKESDVYLLKTSFVFDVSVAELFGWFLGGGRLAILEAGGEKDAGRILSAIEIQEITHINFVPSMFNVFVEGLNEENTGKLSRLKYIFLAGEAILPEVVDKLKRLHSNRHPEMENLYGPTEATIYASRFSLPQWKSTKNSNIPIGTPLQNIELYILDKYNNLQPVGIPGELCIAGKGLARGYLNRPDLTNKKFITNPLVGRERCYCTGDLTRRLPDGNIEFLGRIDTQVKIRGYRIELGEIENLLLSHPAIKEAIVIAKENDRKDKYLCAYIVSHGEITTPELREFLSAALPDYMIPSYFMMLERTPLTPNGKIDKRRLPMPAVKVDDTFAGPENETHQHIVEIWSDLLGIEKEKISIDANFFELGGHSLKAVLLIAAVYKRFNVKISMAKMSGNLTIRGLALIINAFDWAYNPKINSSQNREEVLL